MRIGILGGGQLGRMLWEASVHLKADLDPSPVYHDEALCPAQKAGATVTPGKVIEIEKLTQFFKQVSSFAVENEFLNVTAIQQAWTKTSEPRPSFEGLRIAQDKFEQKKFFLSRGFPTAECKEILPDHLHGEEFLKSLHQNWQGFVLKKARMGYDGKGNLALGPQEVFNFAELKAFCQSAYEADSRIYAEKFIPFEKEVALVSCRSFYGDYGHYPLIETQQKKGVCFLAFRAQNEEAQQRRAVEIARALGEELQMLGTFAVEFFITDKGELLVNEMAPRVHNSGHFSQVAAKSSQFEMHLKAYFRKKWDPTDFESSRTFAMVNFLGPENLHSPVQRPQNPQIYWYDKEKTSPGRKLGHMIVQSSEEKDLPQLLEILKSTESAWRESLVSV